MEGQWVTPREFDQLNRRMDTFEAAQSSMARDIKMLVAAHNLDEGRSLGAAIATNAQRDRGARRIALASLLASAAMAFTALFGHPHQLP